VASPRPGASLRLRWLLGVLAVIVVLTAGWPLVSSTVTGHRPIAAGTTITVGPTASSAGRVTVGPGWSVTTANSNPKQYYAIARGPVRLSIRFVRLARTGQPGPLWRGLRQILRIDSPGVTPGRPQVITTADGRRGIIAALSGPGRIGRAVVVAAPARPFAIEMIVLGPPGTLRAMHASGMPIIRSLRFPVTAP
jgi:hypothetical protein